MGFQESQHLVGLQIRVYWILEEQDSTKLSSDFESDISNNAYLAQLWKLNILQSLYELIKRFAIQPYSSLQILVAAIS